MKAKPALVARVNDGSGAFPRIPVTIRRRAIVFPIERSDGKSFLPTDVIGFYARYSLDGKAHIDPLGKDPNAAYTRFQQIEGDVARMRQGLEPIHKPEPVAVEPEPVAPEKDRSLRTCASQFKANIVALGKKRATVYAYTRAVDDLVARFPDKSIDEIIRQDIIAYMSFLRANMKKRTGDPEHTLRNRLRNLTVFFHSFGLKIPLAMSEMKRPMRTNPTRYSLEFINKLLEHATEQEKDLIHFFLNSGFRDEETAFSKYGDIDFAKGSINVHAKPEFGWTPKDGEARTQDIVLQDRFLERMKNRMERTNRKPSDLIFPQVRKEKPDMHLIKIVQRVAKRAGITDKRITLHSFRRTFGSIVAKEYGIEQARIWLGHSDIETTQHYLAADEMTTEQSRRKVTEMFSGVGD
jgi:integrase